MALGGAQVLLELQLPLAAPLEFCASFKQSHRRDDDIAICTAGASGCTIVKQHNIYFLAWLYHTVPLLYVVAKIFDVHSIFANTCFSSI